jgi:hypothetical protein
MREKCFVDTGGVHVHHLWLLNKPSLSNLAKNIVGKKMPCLFDVIPVHRSSSVTLCYFLGDWVLMHSREAD